MPIYRKFNRKFFEKWGADMAYVLGFFAADGNLTKGKRDNCYIEFSSCDLEIIEKIRGVLESNHKILKRKRSEPAKDLYRLQIGSKRVFKRMLELGFTTQKSLVMKMPSVPEKYFGDFTRGYFDGDGNVSFGYYKKPWRKSGFHVLLTRFTCGSKRFLLSLRECLHVEIGTGGSLSYYGSAWRLSYNANDSRRLFTFMHRGDLKNLIYLKRKYSIYLKAGVEERPSSDPCHGSDRRFESGRPR